MSRQNDDEISSSYAGQWVARLQNRIIAQGGTPAQAQDAARKSRHKEKAEISFVPLATALPLSPLVEQVHAALPDQEIYLVGGAVRDALMGRESHDLDFAVPQNAIGLARRVANSLHADFYVLDNEFDAARVIVRPIPATEAGDRKPWSKPPRDVLDFTSFRPPKDRGAGMRALGVLGALEADQRGRDFTINSIAYNMQDGSILDPLHGGADLRGKTLRACSAEAMHDDAIRILRGVRLAAALEFKIEPSTRQAMKEAASSLPRISAERQRDELFKTLDGPRPDASIRALEMLGAFPYLLPELAGLKALGQSAPHVADAWEHTLSVMQHLESILGTLAPEFDSDKHSDLFSGLLSVRLGRYREQLAAHFADALNSERSMRALLFFAALYHDVSKSTTKTVEASGRIRFLGHEAAGAEVVATRAKAFNLSNDETGRLQTIVANHMRFHFHTTRLENEQQPPSRKSIYHFFRDTGEAGVDLILLGLADLRGVRGPTLTQETWTSGVEVARMFLENYWEKPQETVSPPRLLNGNELMDELGLKPGPGVGELLAAIQEAQAAGELSSREEALELARKRMQQGSRDDRR